MQVKKFEAPSLEVALAMVKREMGPHALILSTEQRKRKWYQPQIVEVTAAQEQKKEVPPEPELDLIKVFPHRKYQVSDAVVTPVKRTTKNLAKYIDIESKARVRDSAPAPVAVSTKVKVSALELDLQKLGFEDATARDIARRIQYEFPKEEIEAEEFREKAIAKILMENVRVMDFETFAQAASWIPVGLSGSGKTTVLVKLAMALRIAKRSVVLASQDERKVTGRSELANYARLIRVPFTVDAKGPRLGKMELVDTPALSFTSEDQNREIGRIQSDRNAVLIVDASQRLSEMLRLHELSIRYNPRAVIFTRLDTVSGHGAIYEFLKTTRLPLLGVSLSASFKVPFKFFENSTLGPFLLLRRGVL